MSFARYVFNRRHGLVSFFLLGLVLSGLRGPVRSAAQGVGQQRVYLPLVTGGASRLPPQDKTTDELIDKAIADGRIDAETGLRYKVFALFGDARLPAEFRGKAPPVSSDRS